MSKLSHSRPLLFIVLLLLAGLTMAGNDVVYRSRIDAPGTAVGVKFYGFQTPVLNNNGQIGFLATLLPTRGGVNAANNSGIWLDDVLIAREGEKAHSTFDGSVFSSFYSPTLNNNGQLVYQGKLLSTTGSLISQTDTGIWKDQSLIAREGFQAPDALTGVHFSSFNAPQMSINGSVAYRGILRTGTADTTPENNQGIWLNNTLQAREGNQAPNTAPDTLFAFFSDPVINNHDQTAFIGHLRRGSGGVNIFNDLGVWSADRLLAREDNIAFGVADGARFRTFTSISINNQGQVAYGAELSGDHAANSGIWRDTTLMVREGDSAEGTLASEFSHFNAPVLNDDGLVAYKASIRDGGSDSSNDSGIWRDNQLIVREGYQAPQTGAGNVFDYISDPVMNNHGQLAYQGFLRIDSGNVTSANDNGLWISGLFGDHVLVAREGDKLEGNKIKSLAIRYGKSSDGHGYAINDYGQLAYEARFYGGDEAIVLFTPDLHWRPALNGDWGNKANWTLGLNPEHVHQVFIDPAASLTVDGPTGISTIKSLELGGGLGIATLQLQAGGQLTVNESVIIMQQGILTGQGALESAGGIENEGEIEADNLTLNATVFNRGLIGGQGVINMRLINESNGVIKAGPLQSLEIKGNNHTNAGRIDVIKGRLNLSGFVNNLNHGRILLDDGEIEFTHHLNNFGQLLNTFGESNVFGTIKNHKDIIISGNSTAHFFGRMENQGNIRVSNHAHALFYETVTGSGDFTGSGHKTILGVFDPGNSTALVSDEGDTTLGIGAELIIEIAGETIGTQHDHFAVQGHLQLGGTLTLALLDGYTPEVGGSFDILDWGTSSGVFDQLDTTQASGILWDVSNLYNTGIIRVASLTGFSTPSVAAVQPVPLPASIWMLISALGTLSLWRKQQHKR